jgi:hypothetical protein
MKKWIAVAVVTMATMAFSAPTVMADNHKKGEAKTEAKAEAKPACPITDLFTGIGGLIEGIFVGIGSLFGGGK